MTDFRTLPVDEGVAWIRAWTDHTWPITLQQAFAIRDALGWKPSPQEPRYFTTKLSINGRENGIISRSNEFGIKGLTFNLSSFPYPNNKQSTQIASTAYSQYITVLERLWGEKKTTNTEGVSLFRWTLPNRVSISISYIDALVSVDIDSPWRTQIREDYDQAMEDYE